MADKCPISSDESATDVEGISSISGQPMQFSKSIRCKGIAMITVLAVVLALVIGAGSPSSSFLGTGSPSSSLVGTPTPSVCLIDVAVGKKPKSSARYLQIAELTGKTKQLYADTWNYRYVPYLFKDVMEFKRWISTTELNKTFGVDFRKLNHPVMKYFPIAHALIENGCDRVLMMDADAIIVNMSFRYDFDLPDVVKGNGDPHMMFALGGFPQGSVEGGVSGSDVVPLGNNWCDTGCSDFTKFWSCLNTGVLYFDNSAETMAFIERLMRINTVGPRASNCSTKSYNPWGADQCFPTRTWGKWGDQCLAGCAFYNQSMELGRGLHELPPSVVCVADTHRPPVQTLMRADWIDDKGEIVQERRIPDGSFIVNIVHHAMKVETALLVMKEYPDLRKLAEEYESQHDPSEYEDRDAYLEYFDKDRDAYFGDPERVEKKERLENYTLPFSVWRRSQDRPTAAANQGRPAAAANQSRPANASQGRPAAAANQSRPANTVV